MMLTALLTTLMAPAVPPELDAFLARAKGKPQARLVERHDGTQASSVRYRLVSQTWQGGRWEHDLEIHQPKRPAARGTAIYVITGDGPLQRDRALVQALLARAELPVVVLYDVPNQPIEGRWEDDLIAHTFEKFLNTGDPTWPLLFPMTLAATRGLDAARDLTAGGPNPLTRFVVTGASKRGWTTWLVGAARRPDVVGLAPAVYDNLDIPAQMAHQLRSWGAYSAMIQDYTERGLQQRLDTTEGRRLGAMVDPYTYRARIGAPTLIINGANDPYWTTDALTLYWDRLTMPRWALVVPNVGHDLGDGRWAIEGLAAFARSRAGLFAMPRAAVRLTDGWVAVAPEWGLRELSLWVAESDTLDFRRATWRQVGATTGAASGEWRVSAPPRVAGKRRALLGVVEYDLAGHRFRLTSPARVVR